MKDKVSTFTLRRKLVHHFSNGTSMTEDYSYTYDGWGRILRTGNLIYVRDTLRTILVDGGYVDVTYPSGARWTTPDPLAEKYYSISPYAYCAGNPVNLVDLKGLDTWEVNEEGRIVSHEENKDADTFYIVHKDENGDYIRTLDAEGNEISISFAYKTVEKIRSISFAPGDKSNVDYYDIIQVRGDDNGTALFEFFSKNITANGFFDSKGNQHGIEFGLVQTGIEGDKGLNFVTTSHTLDKEYGQKYLYEGQLYYGYYLRNIVHSHPNTAYPSGKDIIAFDKMVYYQVSRGWAPPKTGVFYVGSNSLLQNTYDYYEKK